ncbi:hypothetical protein IV203_036091 [Nitzschia inconspicua]|uniref:Uncharacterized protein n=1 Tax=Nitzschia inconspicua TaxID=303405 RepID=A0A9K3LHH4_9STRA|nr:hypothetical protein IV203_036091 [Nitzschia inconspicua]
MHQPILSNYPLPTRLALLGDFAAFIRAGQHQPANKQVPAQTVLLALRAISETHILDGQPDPLADEKGQRHIILKRQIENYRRHDPSPKRKLALPHIAIKYLNVTRADNNPRYQAIHDLCTIAWFLLRVGEYTQTTQTVDAQYNSAWKMSHYGTTHRFFAPPYHSRPYSLNAQLPHFVSQIKRTAAAIK